MPDEEVSHQPQQAMVDDALTEDISIETVLPKGKRKLPDKDENEGIKFKRVEEDFDEKLRKMKESIVSEVERKFEDALKKVVDVNTEETLQLETIKRKE